MKQLLLSCFITTVFFSFAQQGVQPFTGLRCVTNGISSDKIIVELDESTWTSNRLPVGKEFEIKLEDPIGFIEEDGMYFPGIEVLITYRNGDTLGYVPDMMGGEAFEGFSGAQLSNLSLDLGFNEMVHPGDTCLLTARFFDTKNTADLTIWMELVIVASELPLENTWSTYGVSSWEGYKSMASGAEITNVGVTRDTVANATNDLWKIAIDPIAGVSLSEWEEGTLTVMAYDAQLNTTILPANRYTQAIAAPGGLTLAATVSIPLAPSGSYTTYRVRWENADHMKVIDVVSEVH